MNVLECWRLVMKREIRLGREYIKSWEDEAILALCFDYPDPFMQRLIRDTTTRGELQGILDLMEGDYAMDVEWNGNLRIFNI